jgi:homocysteine S-methyltransferase
VGTEIARELLDVTIQHFRGIYLITPFLNYEMSVQLTAHVHAQTKK